MKTPYILIVALCISLLSCQTNKQDKSEGLLETTAVNDVGQNSTKTDQLIIHPISHATMVLTYGEDNIYIDPTGGANAFKELSEPDIVLITDIHGDHMDLNTLRALDLSRTTVIAPKAVIEKLPNDVLIKTPIILQNGDSLTVNGYSIKAVPMYNLREDALKFHSKGRGNGYVLNIAKERIYISGDTEDIPEMRALKNIDKAFVCMNLPYTMTVENAANAVLEFKPKQVYPYHYRGTEGFSDVNTFKRLVNRSNTSIEVVQLNWYKS